MRRIAISLLIALSPALLLRADSLQQVDLWVQGGAGVHTYRIPALVETSSGTLIAVADARHDSARDLPAHISLVMRRSRDGGRTWERSRTLVAVNEGGVGDASLLLDRKTGRVWCFHAYGPPGIGFPTARPGATTGPAALQVHAMHSDDDGATWSVPVDITPQIKDARWYAMFATSGTHIQTSKGRYLVPVVVRNEKKIVSAHNAYSDDAGATWKIGPAIGAGTDESHAVELDGGVIVENMRDGKTRAIARSSDGGVHFGPVEHNAALIDPGCNAGITSVHAGGKQILVFTNAASSKRENLTAKLSYDGGRTWPVSRVLDAGPAAYSTVIGLKDGSIAVLYERGETSPYERITFARFPLTWVETELHSIP